MATDGIVSLEADDEKHALALRNKIVQNTQYSRGQVSAEEVKNRQNLVVIYTYDSDPMMAYSSGKKLLESYLPEGRKGVILFVNDIVTWGKGWCFEKESVGGLNELAEYNGEEGNAGDDVLSHFESVYGVIGYNGWGEKYN